MNPTAQKAAIYLMDGGTRQHRMTALADLDARGAFRQTDDSDTADIIREYLKDNPHQFCGGGLDRFAEHLGITFRREERTVRLTVDITTTSNIEALRPGSKYSYGMARSVREHLMDIGRLTKSVTWGFDITDVDVAVDEIS